jgi:hypothetical protein
MSGNGKFPDRRWPDLSEAERFMQHVSPEPNSGCWLWCAGVDRHGYGRFNTAKLKLVGAHRYSYELHRGAIPKGLNLDHLCRIPSCVNPQHLEPVTQRENVRRGLSGAWQRAKTHCPAGHLYSIENTRYLRNGSARECRLCNNAKTLARYHRKKGHENARRT